MTTSSVVAPSTAPEYRIVLDDQLIVHTRTAIKQRIVDALADGHRDIVVDASQCGYIDSSGLGALLSCQHKAAAVGGTLTIEGLHSELRTLIELTHLDTVLNIRWPDEQP